MKCPECGQWNRASMPHCVRCGAPLNIDESSRIAWKDTLKDGGQSTAYLRADEYGQLNVTPEPRDELAKEMQELKKRKREGEELQERLRRSSEGKTPSVIAEEIPSSGKAETHLRMRRTSAESRRAEEESEFRHKVRFMNDAGIYVDSRTYDPVFPENARGSGSSYTLSPALGGPPEQEKRMGAGKRFLIFLLVLALLGGGGWFVWQRFFSPSDPGEDSNAVITASMLNETAAHTILIPGEDGTVIYVRELHASYPVVDGFATLEIPDHTWYDGIEGTLDETMEVTLTPFLKTSSGRQTPLAPIRYAITIPLSTIELESPDSMRTTVSTTMATIRIVVTPGSRVTVNGEDYSDTVSSETGEMSYNATVHPIGDNVYNFVVRSQYCRDNTLTIVLYREPQEIPLDLAVGTYGTTDRRVMKVSATTLPGAYVTVSTPHSDLDITNLDSTGKFSFNAVFEHIGDNEIVIEASYPGKKTSVVTHTVYYLPPASEYTVKAWPLTEEGYGELLSNMQVRAANNQVYVVTGVVQYQVSEKPQKVVINTSEDGKSQPVLLQNFTNKKWVVGTYYRIYADAASTYNGMPQLNARYTYYK